MRPEERNAEWLLDYLEEKIKNDESQNESFRKWATDAKTGEIQRIKRALKRANGEDVSEDIIRLINLVDEKLDSFINEFSSIRCDLAKIKLLLEG